MSLPPRAARISTEIDLLYDAMIKGCCSMWDQPWYRAAYRSARAAVIKRHGYRERPFRRVIEQALEELHHGNVSG